MNQHINVTVVCVLWAGDLCRNGYSIPLWTNRIPGLDPTCLFPGQVLLIPPLGDKEGFRGRIKSFPLFVAILTLNFQCQTC